MTQDRIMRRLRAANPAPTRPPEADALFERLVAEPGDARLRSTSGPPTRRRRDALRGAATARRAVVTVSVLAGAAVIAVVAGGLSSGTAPHADSGHVVVQAQDTAYLVRQVRARLAADTQADVSVWVQAGGNGLRGSDSTSTTTSYVDPRSGVFHQASELDLPDGTEIYAEYIVGIPVSGGMRFQTTALDPQQHLYAESTDVGPRYLADTNSAAAARQQVRQQLASGQATRDGTATIDGQTTIKLRFPTAGGWSSILYVDAHTYQPLKSVSISSATGRSPSAGQTPSDRVDVNTQEWHPGNAANIAQCELARIPAGFRRVSVAMLHRADTAAR